MARNWTNGSGLALSASNLNALEADVTTALGVPDAALATRVVAGATKTALDGAYAKTTDLAGKEPAIPAGTTSQYIRGDKTLATLDKTAVGLGNIDNTSDMDKPVSLAQQLAISNATGAPRNIEGIPVTAYGNSYMVSPPLSGRATQSYVTRLGNRLKTGTLTNNSVAGSVASHVFFDANSNVSASGTSHAWVPGTNKGLVIYEETINDVVTFGSSVPAQTNYRNALRGLVELWRSGSRVDATNAGITYTGTWTAGVTGYHVAGGKRTTVSGATATFTFTGTEVVVWVNSSATTAPTVTIKEGATTLATVALSNGTATYDAPGVVGTSVNLGPMPIRITGLSAGSHTLVLTSTGTGTTFFDGYSLPSTKPPQIVFVVEGAITSYSPNGSSALHDTYNQILRDVAAEYPTLVTVADVGLEWTSACLNMADGIGNHPNDLGHGILADAVQEAIGSIGYKSGLQIL